MRLNVNLVEYAFLLTGNCCWFVYQKQKTKFMKAIKKITTTISMIAFLMGTANAQDTTNKTNTDTSILMKQKDLTAVVVSSSKQALTIKTDKITLNVAQSPLASGDNIYQVIKRMPGVTEQQDLQFRGKKTAIYINGRPSGINEDELKNYLSSMQANAVEKIEVIINPGVKYDASGLVIINIVLAKNKNLGTNGSFTQGVAAGKYLRYNTGISFNYRNEKMNIYGGYDISHNKNFTGMNTTRFINNNNRISEDQYSLDISDNNAYRIGLDYDINKKSNIGFLIKGTASYRTKNSNNKSLIKYDLAVSDSASFVNDKNKTTFLTPSLNIYYKTKLGKVGGDLTLNADLYHYSKQWNDHFTTRSFANNGQEYMEPSLLRDHSPADNSIKSFSADYNFTKNKNSYEMGIKSVITNTDNDVIWENANEDKWMDDTTRSNHFIYRENINAAYFSASRSIKKFDVKVGIRMEQTNSNGNSITLNEVHKSSYINLFPSLDIYFNQSEKQQFSFSYRRNIERFGFNIVNPFIIYQSQYAYYQGNSNIKPSFSNNFQISWAYNDQWSASASFSHFTDVLAEIYKKGVNINTTISTYNNVSSADQLDINISNTKAFFKNRLTTSNTIGGLFAKYNAGSATGLNHAGYTAYLMTDNNLKFSKNWKAELNISYYSPLSFGAYSFKSQFNTDLGIAKTILKGNGTVALNVNDLFNTNKQQYTIESYNVKANAQSYSESRLIKMAFTYRLGNKNVKASRSRRTGIEDVQRRMSN